VSEEHSPRTGRDRALDIFVYAPAGLVLSTMDDLPRLALRGRTTIEQHMKNARFVGEYVVRKRRREWEAQVDVFQRRLGAVRRPGAHPGAPVPPGRRPVPQPGPTTHPPSPSRSSSVPVDSHGTRPATALAPPGPVGPRPGAVAPTFSARYDTPSVDAVIPGYDTLSASQVVRRLEGLGPHELDAVVHHETARRGRRTILYRAHQLMGTDDQPGTGA
jgi:hypothetical protein